MTAMNAVPADRVGERRFVWMAWGAHLALLTLVACFHEPWRDEFQAWRLAIDSPGLGALWANTRFEGHPLLWHVLLQALGVISKDWWIVAAFHTALTSGTAWLILRHAPLPRWQRLAMIASFFLFYGYGIIIRSYGLGVFLVFAACAAWTAERRRPWLAGVLLALAANTTVFGLLVAASVAFAFWVEWAWPEDGSQAPTWSRRLANALALGCVATLVVGAVYLQVVQPPTSAFQSAPLSAYDGWRWRVGEVLATGARAFFPNAILNPNGVEWRFGLAYSGTRAGLALIDGASLLVLVLGSIATIRRRSATLLFVVGFAGITAFVALIFGGAQRHHGHLTIIWLVALWLSGVRPATGGTWGRWTQRLQRFSGPAVAVLSISLVSASVQFAIGELRYPFSDATRVAEFLRRPQNASLPIISLPQGEGISVAAQLEQPVFIAVEGRAVKFATWWFIDPSIGERDSGKAAAIATVRRATRELHRVCEVLILVTDREPIPEALRTLGTEVWRSTGIALIGERYAVWRLSSPYLPQCPSRRALP